MLAKKKILFSKWLLLILATQELLLPSLMSSSEREREQNKEQKSFARVEEFKIFRLFFCVE
jgi:hypothetical protein